MALVAWFVLVLLFLALEMLLPGGFYFVCLAVGALAAGAATLLAMGPLSVWSVFLGVSTLGVFLAAPMARLWLHHIPARPVGVDALLGQRGQVTEAVEPRSGRGEVWLTQGGTWLASADTTIACGAWVEVLGVSGTRLRVRPLTEVSPAKE